MSVIWSRKFRSLKLEQGRIDAPCVGVFVLQYNIESGFEVYAFKLIGFILK